MTTTRQFGGRTTGNVAWGWQFAPAWRVSAGAGTAFKAPTFNDLYYPGFSNPELRPERSRNSELGLRWSGPLWERMKGLTEESLTAATGAWIGKGEIKAILERRQRMQADIDRLIKEKGEDAVVMK